MAPPAAAAAVPPAPPSLPPVKDSHNDLMSEIRKGGTLRRVSPEKVAAARPAAGMGDTRDNLLGQIRQGVTLKRVVEGEGGAAVGEGPHPPASGIAGALHKALQERGMVMGMSSSEESDCDEDDEWDD
jgi:hypothetical protein